MKDAKGHGSDGRGGSGDYGTIKTSGLKGVGIGASFRAGPSQMKPDRDMSDTNRSVADLRSRMSGTGPGHKAGLLQGIKNFLGG